MGRVNIGIVGLNFGRTIIRQLQTEENRKLYNISAVCATTPEKVAKYAAEIGAKAYVGLDGLLEDPQVKAVGLFTGPAGRVEMIRKIIRAGKDVVTTKPFELNAEAALEVLREAKKLGRVVHLNSPSPLLPPDLLKIKEWVDEYGLGRPIACRGDYWVSYREEADGTWFDDPVKCPAAPIFRLGIYVVNDLVRLFGKAEKVSVLHSRIFTGRPTPDNAQLGIQFKNGAIANIFASFCIEDGQMRTSSMTLNYEKGTVYHNAGCLEEQWDEESVCLALYTPREGSFRVDRNGSKLRDCDYKVTRECVRGKSGEYQWEAFYRAVNGKTFENEVTPEEIVEGIRIMNAMARADQSGRIENV